MTTADGIRKTVQGYVDTMTAGDREAWIDLFSDDVLFEDPVGSEVVKGRAAMLDFWNATRKEFPTMSLKLVQGPAICGNEAAYVIHAEIAMNGASTVVKAIDVAVFDENDRFQSVRAYWDADSTTTA